MAFFLISKIFKFFPIFRLQKMNFKFILILSLLMHETLSFNSMFQSPLENRYNLIDVNIKQNKAWLASREKETIALIKKWRQEMEEILLKDREEKIFRQHFGP